MCLKLRANLRDIALQKWLFSGGSQLLAGWHAHLDQFLHLLLLLHVDSRNVLQLDLLRICLLLKPLYPFLVLGIFDDFLCQDILHHNVVKLATVVLTVSLPTILALPYLVFLLTTRFVLRLNLQIPPLVLLEVLCSYGLMLLLNHIQSHFVVFKLWYQKILAKSLFLFLIQRLTQLVLNYEVMELLQLLNFELLLFLPKLPSSLVPLSYSYVFQRTLFLFLKLLLSL